MPGIFVTGTDTGIGKTAVAVRLMAWLRGQGWSVAGMKPVASGCERVGGKLLNADALALKGASSIELDYEEVNPYGFAEPVSPHLAAEIAGRPVNLEFIADAYRGLADRVDCVVVEGVGGWFAPLTQRETVADMARLLELPVLLVVGLRLGCINHALLSGQAIAAGGAECLGWVANQAQPDYDLAEANLEDLKSRMDSPCIGHFPYIPPKGGTQESASAGVGGFDDSDGRSMLRRLALSVTLP